MRLPLESIRAVTIGKLSQVLDHRIARSLGRSAHLVPFIEGRELHYSFGHVGRLTELASLWLCSTVCDDGSAVFDPLSPSGPGR